MCHVHKVICKTVTQCSCIHLICISPSGSTVHSTIVYNIVIVCSLWNHTTKKKNIQAPHQSVRACVRLPSEGRTVGGACRSPLVQLYPRGPGWPVCCPPWRLQNSCQIYGRTSQRCISCLCWTQLRRRNEANDSEQHGCVFFYQQYFKNVLIYRETIENHAVLMPGLMWRCVLVWDAAWGRGLKQWHQRLAG